MAASSDSRAPGTVIRRNFEKQRDKNGLTADVEGAGRRSVHG